MATGLDVLMGGSSVDSGNGLDVLMAGPSAQSGPPTPSRPPLTGFTADAIPQLGRNAGNMLAGALRGAGSIGATLLAPYDMARDALDGKGLSLDSNRQRRADMDSALANMGADSSQPTFSTAKLASEVAGTSGVGPALALPLKAAASTPALSRFLGPLAESVSSGGFSLGTKLPLAASIPARAAGGAINGGAQAGLVDPDSAGTGAMIGGALPVVAQGAGKTVQAVINAFRVAKTPQDVKVAQQLAQQLGVTADDLQGALTGPQMIPGYTPTVPQMLQDPAASQLQRTLQTAGHQSVADAGRMQQGQFRDALGGIAPLGTTVQDAAERAGTSIEGFARPAQQAARQNVSSLFDSIPDAQATMQLPLQQMQNAQSRFVGPGTFGKGNGTVEQAMGTATNIGTNPLSPLESRAVPFSQIQALRSSIGEAITTAQANGNNQAAAALTAMKNAIDNKVADVAAGNAVAGEVFTPQAIDQWGQALNAHGAMRQQFNTGPQASMFRMGADGQPAIQGAEIPGKFYNGNRSQVQDVQSFQRLVGNREDLARELKSYALTQGVDTATQNGNLAQSFIDWAKSRSGANKALFSQQEQATIKEVSKAVERQIAAENLGRVSGPDTAQKLASLQSNGLLDNRMVDAFAHRIPILGNFTGPMLDGLRRSAAQARGGIQAGLLADPLLFSQTLRRNPSLLDVSTEPMGLLTRGAYPALLGQ